MPLKGLPYGPNLLDLRAIQAEKARRRMTNFTTWTFPEYEVNWHHRVLCEYLDRFVAGEILRLMVFMPPRHGKSELVSRRLPAKILGNNPDAQIIACSYSADLSSRMNRDVQRIMDSPEYQELFPSSRLWGANVRSVAQGAYLRNSDIFEIVGHRGGYRSAGVGGGITGMGMNFGIIDDPIKNAEEAESAVHRDRLWDWYTSTFYTRLERRGAILITLTRWHQDDLAGRLLALAAQNPDADQWTVLDLPAVAEEKARIPEDRREPGEPLWPGKYSREELTKIKVSLGSYQWSGLYQQRPSSPEGGILKRHWWRFWQPRDTNLPSVTLRGPDGQPVSVEAIPLPKLDRKAQSWDMAFKDTKSSAYVVGQVWGSAGADRFLLDQDRRKLNFPATIQAVRLLSEKWPDARAKWVEDKANGPAVISTLQGQIAGLIAVQPSGSKEARVHAASPYVEGGNVYLPHPAIAPWVWEFIEECAAFPNGTYADQVDAFTQAILQFETGKRRAGTW